MSGLFQAAIGATEEAIYNSLFRAMAVTSRGTTVEPMMLDAVREILEHRLVGFKNDRVLHRVAVLGLGDLGQGVTGDDRVERRLRQSGE